MKKNILLVSLITALMAGTAFPQQAGAQYSGNRAMQDRVDKMERDLMLLQRQISRGGAPAYGSASPAAGGTASLEVRLDEIEQTIRELRGKVEENEFQLRRVSENLQKFQEDVEFRLNEQASAAPTPPSASYSTEPDEEPEAPVDTRPRARDADTQESPYQLDTSSEIRRETPLGNAAAATSDTPGTLRVPTELPPGTAEFTSSREHYNQAFRLLNQTRYEEAASLFKSFTEKYPNDPLIGNAYYWLGETYYIRSNYVEAADNFRQGFEALASGPKAADNLLKLGMSLNALQKTQEACIVLDQLLLKFRDSSTAVAQKAEQERNRIGCR